METNCARCGRKVKPADNWLKAHLWASTAVLHWSCFGALLREHAETGPERMAGPGKRVGAQLPAEVERKVEIGE